MPSQSNSGEVISAAPTTDKKTQAIFDLFMLNGMEIIYDEKQAQSMLPRVSSGGDPTKAIAELLVDIIVRVVSSARENGKKIPPGIILHGGNMLFGELLKVLEAAGMEPLTEEQKAAVWQVASSLYIDQAVKSGEMTKEELVALSQEVEQTPEGKKVLQTAENPEEVIKQIEKPPRQDTVIPDAADASTGIAAPQGGI